MTEIRGTVAPGFESLRDAFDRSFDGKPEMGAALAVRHRGRLVADLSGGEARPGVPWEPDTLGVIFSCTKGLMSILVARLVQDGRLRYEDRVADHWPEFAAAGKGDVTVGDLLAHRAGLSAPRDPISTEAMLDWDGVVAQLAAQEPLWEPGSAYAYHAITHGWLAGEVVRRVTGLSPGTYFRQVVADPLGADAWIGLPPDLAPRVADMRVGPTLAQLTATQVAEAPADAPDWPGLAMTLGGALPREPVAPGEGFNDPRVQRAEVPGAGGIASARAVATIWSATIVETEGVRLLDDATLSAGLAPRSEGPPFFEVPGPWPRWGAGFQLDSEARRYVTTTGFGHDGAGGQVAFADPEAEVGFAFLTSQMEAIDDVRATRIVDALRDALR